MTLSTEKPQYGFTTLLNVHLRKRLPLDGGNRFIKYLDPLNRVRILPSVVKELESWEDAEPDDKSVVIAVDGHRYVIGQLAAELGGKSVFEEDKCELAWLLALAAIEPNLGQNQVLIEVMAVALPDSRNKQAIAAIKRVEGVKDFTRNGVNIVATVRQVEPCDETRPAYKFARSKGLFRAPNKVNGILDLGGGTGIGRLYAPNGTMIRTADTLLPGTYQLAQKIAGALLPQLGYSPELRLIMDAIADNSYLYGTTEINFEPIFQKCREQWIGEVRSKLKVAWTQQLSDLGEVLIIGGSATLAQPLVEATKGRFKIASHPNVSNFAQLISLYGMGME
ncbi:ParM/StbA family protein [Trichocoleus sp. DQ-A3]|uniref:ParM/StbA family protein n=1 Tax=Cyanophyceae TaxID=3028117 RepID=UPI00168A23F1|nr:ParM/StbA family protein [Coleofasciculus sp. FACHB-125]MBD1903746.1 ParM/StbA family protein [Coleofasciculus sp. FACHB-125]